MALWVNGQQVSHLGPGFPNENWIADSFYPDPNGPAGRVRLTRPPRA
jgi:hypothetical protein